jgi:hypothetical protein
MTQSKKETFTYTLVSTLLAGLAMFSFSQIYGVDGAIILGILLVIASTSAIRYNQNT